DGAVPVDCSVPPGTPFPVGVTTITCKATDQHGNHASGEFTVTVHDTTPPVLHVPADISAEATSPAGASVDYQASADDIVDGPITPSCGTTSASAFPAGTTTVTCTAKDEAGNTASDTFTVEV